MARCLLIESKLSKNLGVYALMASGYIRNCCYNKNTRKTLKESFTSSKPDLNKMHIFGMTCFCYVQNKMKLDPRCEKGIFVSYDGGARGVMVIVTGYGHGNTCSNPGPD